MVCGKTIVNMFCLTQNILFMIHHVNTTDTGWTFMLPLNCMLKQK